MYNGKAARVDEVTTNMLKAKEAETLQLLDYHVFLVLQTLG